MSLFSDLQRGTREDKFQSQVCAFCMESKLEAIRLTYHADWKQVEKLPWHSPKFKNTPTNTLVNCISFVYCVHKPKRKNDKLWF